MSNRFLQIIPAPENMKAEYIDGERRTTREVSVWAVALMEDDAGEQSFQLLEIRDSGDVFSIGEDSDFLQIHYTGTEKRADTYTPVSPAVFCPYRNGACVTECAMLETRTVHGQTVRICRTAK